MTKDDAEKVVDSIIAAVIVKANADIIEQTAPIYQHANAKKAAALAREIAVIEIAGRVKGCLE